MASIRAARVYGHRPPEGATQVLVDRVWPRGIRKEALGEVLWMREVGPSDPLRRWFGHQRERWPEFRERYRAELAASPRRELVDQLAGLARRGPLTLLYGARDEEHNQAVVLRELLEERLQA